MWKDWKSTTGLFVIPAFFSLAQSWASQRIIVQVALKPQPDGITDGILYIQQSWQFQGLGGWLYNSLLYGLYQGFLSLMHLPDLGPAWDSADPRVLPVYEVQSLLLAGATAVFLFCSFRFSTGPTLKRIAVSALLGILWLSPLVIVWPSYVLMESLTLTTLLLVLSACIGFDAQAKHSLMAIGFTIALLILVRDPAIFFVSAFAALLGLNVLLSRRLATGRAIVGVAALLAVIALGAARIGLISQTDKYFQPLVNVIQLRILPDPESRAYFADHGLPTSPTVIRLARKPAWYENLLFAPADEVSPDYLAYRNWVISKGFKTYAEFLLTHPGYLARSIALSPNLGPDDDFGSDTYFSMSELFSSPRAGYGANLAPYPLRMRDFLLAPLGWMISLGFFAYCLAKYVIRTFRREQASSQETLALAAFAAAFASYHADGLDLWRHCIPYILVIYTAFVFRMAELATSPLRKEGWARRLPYEFARWLAPLSMQTRTSKSSFDRMPPVSS